MRAVLDTNTIISALVFKGPANRLAQAWQTGRFKLLATPSMVEEYRDVLGYAKFKNSEETIAAFLNEGILPFLEPIQEHTAALPFPCTDPKDDRFLRAALGGQADWLVTGDLALLKLKGKYKFEIETIAQFLKVLG